jgi:hypothetical protein
MTSIAPPFREAVVLKPVMIRIFIGCPLESIS